jgi:hypothetical protein
MDILASRENRLLRMNAENADRNGKPKGVTCEHLRKSAV